MKEQYEKEMQELFSSAVHLTDNAELMPVGHAAMEDCYMVSVDDFADLVQRLQDVREVKANS